MNYTVLVFFVATLFVIGMLASRSRRAAIISVAVYSGVVLAASVSTYWRTSLFESSADAELYPGPVTPAGWVLLDLFYGFIPCGVALIAGLAVGKMARVRSLRRWQAARRPRSFDSTW